MILLSEETLAIVPTTGGSYIEDTLIQKIVLALIFAEMAKFAKLFLRLPLYGICTHT